MSKRPKITASPFDGLAGLMPVRLPKTASSRLVVEGKPITDVRQLGALVDSDEAERLAELKAGLKLSRNQARYQKQRQDPEAMAARDARAEQAKAERREYMRKYRQVNRDRIRERQTAWERRSYRADPEAAAAKARAWYLENQEKARAQARERYQRKREQILARAAEKRAEKRAQALAAAAAARAATPFTTIHHHEGIDDEQG